MTVKMSGLISNLDTDSIVEQLVSAYNVKVDNVEKKKTKLEWKVDAWKTLNTSTYSFFTDDLSDMRFTNTYSSKSTSISDTSVATVTASDSTVNGTQTLSVKTMATSGYLTGAKLATTDSSTLSSSTTLSSLGYTGSGETLTVTIGSTSSTISVDSSTTISSLVTQLKSAGLTASFDSTNGRIFVSSSSSGAASNFTLTTSSTTSDDASNALFAFGLSTSDSATKIEGVDAEIELNGATFTSSSNTFTINGLTLAIKETTKNSSGTYDTVSITTDTDYQGIYDKIKSFLSSYNKIITAMDTAYYADSASGYEPLTDDEKDAMSDTEVEKWEAKIKAALLRKDSTLGELSSGMKNAMNSVITVGGTKYSLSNYGINTENYFTASDEERGVLHIDGDEDDDETSDNSDKLLTAITADPDTVISFFTSLSKTLYNKLNDSMSSTSLRSAYTIYNDKEMDEQIDDYEDDIDTLNDKITAMENKYYSQFSAMEVALAKLQSSSSALSGLTS